LGLIVSSQFSRSGQAWTRHAQHDDVPFIFQYALDTPSVGLQAQTLAGPNDVNEIPLHTQNTIRALVLPDHLSFASAMWFYTKSGDSKTGCTASPGMVDELRLATLAGWEEYITNCIFTTVTPERQAFMRRPWSFFRRKPAAETDGEYIVLGPLLVIQRSVLKVM
jgi:hypothetical protein